MRKLVYISFVFLALSIVFSCSRSVDKRLVLADTLMWTNPDSSLAILENINRDSLQGEENLAYHALLLTQAQFRVDFAIPSDTFINFALNHYSDNHNREHYTRALLYKGAYYEVNDNPVEAIKWYKQSESNADSADYRNLAQINMRMGMLYYNYFADHNIDLDKFKKSLKYYTLMGAKDKMMLAHGYMGKIFRLTNQDSAQCHLDIAISLAQEIGDSADLFDFITSKSLSCFIDKDYHKAKDLAVFSIKNGRAFINDHSFYNAARAYCALNKIDSALLFVNLAEKNPYNKQLLSIRYLTLYEIYDSIGDIVNYKKYNSLFNELTDSLSNNNTIINLIHVEEKQVENNKSAVIGEKNLINKKFKYSIFILVLLSICFVALVFKIKKDKQILLETMESIKTKSVQDREQLHLILTQLENKTKYLDKEISIKDSYSSILKDMVSQHIIIMDRLANTYETGSEKSFKNEFKSIVAEYSKSDVFWNAALQYVNNNYNGLVDTIHQQFPKITEKQTKIVILHCLGFDYVNCAVIFGTSTRSMGVMCSRLADKFGTDLSLKKFIEELKSQCLLNNNLLKE